MLHSEFQPIYDRSLKTVLGPPCIHWQFF